MHAIAGIDSRWGVTAVRIVMAAIFMAAGYTKFASGLSGTIGYFGKMGIPAPGVAGPFIASLELVGGVLLLLGVFARWLGLLYAVEFIVAAFWVKVPTQGWLQARLDLMLLAGGILLFLAGPGRAALDELWSERSTAADAMAHRSA